MDFSLQYQEQPLGKTGHKAEQLRCIHVQKNAPGCSLFCVDKMLASKNKYNNTFKKYKIFQTCVCLSQSRNKSDFCELLFLLMETLSVVPPLTCRGHR